MKTKKNLQTTAFAVNAPAASCVQLAGDFTGWSARPLNLKKAAGGMWKISVRLLPGVYEYRFLVDGTWRDDPACALRHPNPFGTENAVRIVE